MDPNEKLDTLIQRRIDTDLSGWNALKNFNLKLLVIYLLSMGILPAGFSYFASAIQGTGMSFGYALLSMSGFKVARTTLEYFYRRYFENMRENSVKLDQLLESKEKRDQLLESYTRKINIIRKIKRTYQTQLVIAKAAEYIEVSLSDAYKETLESNISRCIKSIDAFEKRRTKVKEKVERIEEFLDAEIASLALEEILQLDESDEELFASLEEIESVFVQSALEKNLVTPPLLESSSSGKKKKK